MKTILAFLFPCVLLFVCSCSKEQFTTDPKANIEFSKDTLSFDTIFSEISSRTLKLTVHNKNNKSIKLNKIELNGGVASVFRFNVDGFASPETNVIDNGLISIGANDSIFVMVEITPQKNQKDTPIYVSDKLIFHYNNKKKELILEAFGQDAIILRNYRISENQTFNAKKPYLVFGHIWIESGKTLTIDPGTYIYMHKGANIVVEGNIHSNGTISNPVHIRGDRFDLAYTDTPYSFLPAQWGTIYFRSERGENLISGTRIVGGDLGIILNGTSNIPIKLKVENSVVHGMKGYGFLSNLSDLEIINSEISNCGNSCVAQWGGKLKITQSTIADYTPFVSRVEPAVLVSNYFLENGNDNNKDNDVVLPMPVNLCVIENSIIFGYISNELVLRDTTGIDFNVFVNHCLIKAKKSDRREYSNITWSYAGNDNTGKTDDVFENISLDDIKEKGYFNFKLSQDSRAKNIANRSVSALYPIDLSGKNRLLDGTPDLGAYEK